MGSRILRIMDLGVLVLIVIGAGKIVCTCGTRGFFAFDQSIVFDGAYRVFQGQIIYKDFVIPVGPITFWLQALFFFLGGVSYRSYVAHAAVGNCLASVCVYFILRRLYPTAKLWPALGSLLTALYFYPPFGTPWLEQTAFLFVLIGLLLIILPASDPQKPPYLSAFAAGVCAALAFLSKQNAGLFSMPMLLALVLFRRLTSWNSLWKGCLIFFLGLSATALAFLTWLWIWSDFHLFWKHVFTIPSGEGLRRLSGDMYHTVVTLTLSDGPFADRLGFVCGGVAAGLFLLVCLWNLRQDPRMWMADATACFLALGAVFTQNSFILSTKNQPENGYPFLGIILAAGGASVWKMLRLQLAISFQGTPLQLPSPKLVRGFFLLGFAGLTAWIGAVGFRAAWSRSVHDLFEGADFSQRCQVPILGEIKWSSPTSKLGQQLTTSQLEAIVSYLQKRDERFVVFTDYTILYAMLRQPSPQPLLWFHKGLTYPQTYDPQIDRWIADSLAANEVKTALVEENAWWGDARKTLEEDFPLVQQFLLENFVQHDPIGPFRIYERITTK
jgi:hypothetical protein